jgi:hypothetical protein
MNMSFAYYALGEEGSAEVAEVEIAPISEQITAINEEVSGTKIKHASDQQLAVQRTEVPQREAAKIDIVANQPEKNLKIRVKERIVTFAKNYMHNVDPRGKDKSWWAGALTKVGLTAATAAVVPVALPAVSLTTAAFRVGQYGGEKLNKRMQKKRLGEEGYSELMKERAKNQPGGLGKLGRFTRGIGAMSALTAIGIVAA